jgi:hypothetical protein
MKLQRVQLSRKRGWRMPAGTSKIDRSTRWGNPFKAGESAVHPASGNQITVRDTEQAVELFALYLQTPEARLLVQAARKELGGKNLACWCKVGHVCHGDVLLQLANA